jgi:hypothetical protein
MYSHDVDIHPAEHKHYGWGPRRMFVEVESQVPGFGIVHKHGDLHTAWSAPVVGQESLEREVGACRAPTLRFCVEQRGLWN